MGKSEAEKHLRKLVQRMQQEEARLLAACGPHVRRSKRAFNLKTIQALEALLLAEGKKLSNDPSHKT